MLLKSSKCVRFDFRCTAADVAATLTASVTLLADADDDTLEGPAARATTGRAGDGPLAMTFGAQGSCWYRSTSEFQNNTEGKPGRGCEVHIDRDQVKLAI